MSNKSYEKQFPQLYYSAMEDGWYCKICSSFSDIRITDQAFEIRQVLLAIIQPADQTNIYHLLGTKKASKINKLMMNFRKKTPTCGNFYKKLVYCKQP